MALSPERNSAVSAFGPSPGPSALATTAAATKANAARKLNPRDHAHRDLRVRSPCIVSTLRRLETRRPPAKPVLAAAAPGRHSTKGRGGHHPSEKKPGP